MTDLKGLRLTTVPATPMFTTDEAKIFLRVDSSAENDLIDEFIEEATRQVENHIRRGLISQTWTLVMDRFDDSFDEHDIFPDGVHNIPRVAISGNDHIFLPRFPLISITSLKTTDVDESQTTFDASNYDFDPTTGRLFLINNSVWPTNLRDHAAVEIIYKVGYGAAADDVPAPIRSAIRAQVVRLYDERDNCAGLSESIKCELSNYTILDYLGFS